MRSTGQIRWCWKRDLIGTPMSPGSPALAPTKRHKDGARGFGCVSGIEAALKLVLMAGLCAMALAEGGVGVQAGGKEEKRMHVETVFVVTVQAPYEETAALFGPEGERAWAGKHWDPQFVYPQPASDRLGAVFTISHGAVNAVWVIAQHDVEARHFQYVYFIPEVMVTTIDVRFRAVDSKTTQVTVTYARTAVSREGDAHVKAMSEGDQTAGKDWQGAIDAYLAAR